MTDDETYKQIVREKGCCGEVSINKDGVKVVCIETCEQHHRERDKLKKAMLLISHYAQGVELADDVPVKFVSIMREIDTMIAIALEVKP